MMPTKEKDRTGKKMSRSSEKALNGNERHMNTHNTHAHIYIHDQEEEEEEGEKEEEEEDETKQHRIAAKCLRVDVCVT